MERYGVGNVASGERVDAAQCQQGSRGSSDHIVNVVGRGKDDDKALGQLGCHVSAPVGFTATCELDDQ